MKCQSSIRDNLHEMSNPVLWGEGEGEVGGEKNITNLSSAELAQTVVIVKQDLLFLTPFLAQPFPEWLIRQYSTT